MARLTESTVESAALAWLEALGHEAPMERHIAGESLYSTHYIE